MFKAKIKMELVPDDDEDPEDGPMSISQISMQFPTAGGGNLPPVQPNLNEEKWEKVDRICKECAVKYPFDPLIPKMLLALHAD